MKLASTIRFLFGTHTGLEWRRVDLQRCTAWLDHTKNGTPRGVPLNRDAVAVLELLQPNPEDAITFHRPQSSSLACAKCMSTDPRTFGIAVPQNAKGQPESQPKCMKREWWPRAESNHRHNNFAIISPIVGFGRSRSTFFLSSGFQLTLKNGEAFHVWVDVQTFLEVTIEGAPRRVGGTMRAGSTFMRLRRRDVKQSPGSC